LAIAVTVPGRALAADIPLAWDPVPETAAGYVVFVTSSTADDEQRFDAGPATSFVYSAATPGTTY